MVTRTLGALYPSRSLNDDLPNPPKHQLEIGRTWYGSGGRELFTVVLTPHHDKAHDNHVHLELVPGVDWTYVR